MSHYRIGVVAAVLMVFVAAWLAAPAATSRAFMAGAAHAKMSWKKVTITAANRRLPATGWSSTRSMTAVTRDPRQAARCIEGVGPRER